MISTEVDTALTSAPPGNDPNSSLSNQFSYIVYDLEAFTEAPALTIPIMGLFKEEATAAIIVDITRIDVLYHNIIQH